MCDTVGDLKKKPENLRPIFLKNIRNAIFVIEKFFKYRYTCTPVHVGPTFSVYTCLGTQNRSIFMWPRCI